MTLTAQTIQASMDNRVGHILEACTACGKCVEACPTPALSGLDVSEPKAVADGVLDILRLEEVPENARRWALECCGSGQCVDVCQVGINPRFMLTMARQTLSESIAEPERRAQGKADFKAMSRGVRVLSRLQLAPDVIDRLSPSSHPERATPPDLVFYTGCNMLKTPHIGLLCLDVLDRLGASYEVYGGPPNCCGVLPFRPGDTTNAVRQAARSLQRFSETGAAALVSWCPTCQLQFSEIMTPGPQSDGDMDMKMFPVYLAERLDQLRPLMTGRVEKRVALHEYPGSPGVVESVKALLGAIPGLQVIDIENPGVGYQLMSLNGMPNHRDQHLTDSLRQAEATGVTTLAGIYHADHRELVAHENQWPFEIVNYMELIGESLGVTRPDLFKRLKWMGDADAVISETKDLIEVHGLDLEEARDVILSDMIDDQYLPIDRARHPGAS